MAGRSLIGFVLGHALYLKAIHGGKTKNDKLDADSRNRLVTWIDTYAQRLGSFSEQQERELLAYRRDLGPLLSEPSTSLQP